MMPNSTRNGVFVSYSHQDKTFLDELLVQLKPLERANLVTKWSDQQIAPGAKWPDEIKNALASARVVVFLVSPDFLASDFIHDQELEPTLKEADQGNVRVFWVPIRASNYKHTPLEKYQAVIPPETPLARMVPADRDVAWVIVCDKIHSHLNP